MNIMIGEDDYVLAKDLQSIAEAAGNRCVGPLLMVEQTLAYAATADIAQLADGPTGAALGRQLIDRFRLEVICNREAGRCGSRPGWCQRSGNEAI